MTLPTLDILIATCNNRIAGLERLNIAAQAGVRLIVVHQLFGDYDEAAITAGRAYLESRDDVVLETRHEQGLARSRALALSLSTADVCLICDDDVVFRDGAFEAIRKSFGENPDVAVMTYRIAGLWGGGIKPYKEQETWVRPIPHAREAAYYWSVEIAFRREAILKAGMAFETRIGLGTSIPTGEDTLFLMHAWEKQLGMAHCKQVILACPEEHSEHQEGYRDWYARGVVWPRVYGWRVALPMMRRRHWQAVREAPLAVACWRNVLALGHGLLAHVLYYRWVL